MVLAIAKQKMKTIIEIDDGFFSSVTYGLNKLECLCTSMPFPPCVMFMGKEPTLEGKGLNFSRLWPFANIA